MTDAANDFGFVEGGLVVCTAAHCRQSLLDRKFEDVVKSTQDAAVLVLVYWFPRRERWFRSEKSRQCCGEWRHRFRRSELAKLKWADLHLEEAKPFVLVRAPQ